MTAPTHVVNYRTKTYIVLCYARTRKGWFTADDYREFQLRNPKNIYDVGRNFKVLVKNGYLEQVGELSRARYRITKAGIDALMHVGVHRVVRTRVIQSKWSKRLIDKRKEIAMAKDNESSADALRILADAIELVEQHGQKVQLKIYPSFLREVADELDALHKSKSQDHWKDIEVAWNTADPEIYKLFNVWLKKQRPQKED